jgi:hypothetical protein
MKKKLLILSLSIAVLLILSISISSVNAEGKWGKIGINWKIAGTIAQSIEVFNPANGEPIGLHSLINLTAMGWPGPAKITLLSMSTSQLVDPCSDCINEGYFYGQVNFIKNDMVAMFHDQSLLFGSIVKPEESFLCFGPAGTYFRVYMKVTGGKGKFEKVSYGELTGEGHGYPVNDNATLAGENGRIKGWIEFSDN